MIRRPLVSILLVFGFLAALPLAHAQDWAKPVLKNLQRLDLRDLGYPEVNEVPENSSAITSLLTAGDGKIYGATSGEQAYLVVFDPALNKVRHLGRIAGEPSVHHSLVEDADGFLYLGTGRNPFDPLPLSKGIPGQRIDEALWQDITARFKDYPGGRLYRYHPRQSNDRVKLPDMECELEDLGIPRPHNSIYALSINPARGEIHGITYPDGHFFIYRIDERKFTDLGEVDENRVFHGPERDWRSLPRALVCDEAGRVFTSGTGGLLKYYSPESGKLEATDLKVPGDYYHVHFYKDHAVVECFAKAPSGLIYGGTCDGYLFSLDPDTMKLVNLGKARASRRLRCLAVAADGKVYFMAGERSAARPCQLYCYDSSEGGFDDLGLVIVDRSPYYYWRGYQFDAMTTGADGTIYLGESERKSHLFLLIP
ncbi:MAG: hypothetical protein HUU20_00135 [Pirellulales bacterium]|nr:hypothetical protein [Pirellulales bacterium]